jgi:signal transduction histidine kinase
VPPVEADPAKLNQVLLNLARNAMEAMGTGGSLELRLRLQDGFVELSIHDDGPGIPSQVLPKIFEPFFTPKERGTGLGLPLSQQIVREHGGRLECISVPGQGTTFRLLLPLNR